MFSVYAILMSKTSRALTVSSPLERILNFNLFGS